MWNTLKLVSKSECETLEIGARIGTAARAGDVILLYGELGAGKTRLAKGIVSVVTGVSEHEVSSPTYTLVNTFEGPPTVHHADLYRIGPTDVDDLALQDALLAGGILVVEWAEHAPEDLWDDPLKVWISHRVERNRDIRELILEWRGTRERVDGVSGAADSRPES